MADVLEYRARRRGPGDSIASDRNELTTGKPPHPLDSEKSRKLLRQLLQWFYYERDRQAANRLEMAIDADFYDGLQWDEEDAAIVTDRGQMPLTYNEVAPMADWIIGTERRNRVDWKVLPRTEDDVELADTKTKVLKYVSDVNKVPFVRSRAFTDAVKAGLGWVDDGARDDPTKDILYSKWEDWRNVLHDSSGMELDTEDWRYVFRWRWVDEDIAALMFPDRADKITTAVEDFDGHLDPLVEEDTWTTPFDSAGQVGRSGTTRALGSGYLQDAQRRRVKLIECQFRMPVATKVITSGPLKGAYFDPRDTALREALGRVGGTVIDKIMMRVHVAVFTETDLLALGPSIYRHNRFSLTPIWCYRRGRDRLPYSAIRRVRDIQKDLNKRASKALWLLNTNQVIADQNAVDDIEVARDEAQRPDGYIEKKAGKEFLIRRDTDAATGQMQIMAMDAQSIQKSAGVTDENLGRKTNAISGEAIKARQMQGAVVTTELFDNLRLAVQVQGEKQLSLVEQFYTEEKVIRLTGAKGAIEWVKINVPELQADGSYRYLNDITASAADFVVSEQDYAGTLRQVMFDAMQQLAQRLPPEIALRFLIIAFEFSDLPNKDEISDQIRRLTGDRDPNKKMTPEEEQQAQMQMQQQAEAMEVARQTALATLEEQQGKAREVHARASKLDAEIEQLMSGRGGEDGAGLAQARDIEQQMKLEQAVRQVQEAAADQIDKLSQQLAKLQSDQTTAVLKINRDADVKAETARMQASATERAAELTAMSNKQFDALLKKLDQLSGELDDVRDETKREVEAAKKEAADAASAAEETAKKVDQVATAAPAAATAPPPAAPAPAPAAAAAAPGPAAQPVVLMVQPPAPVEPPKPKAVSFNYDAAGGLTGATVKRADGSTEEISIDRQVTNER